MKTIRQHKDSPTTTLGESKEAVRTRPSAILLHLHYFLLLSIPHCLPPLQANTVTGQGAVHLTADALGMVQPHADSQTISDQQAYLGLIPRPMSLYQTV